MIIKKSFVYRIYPTRAQQRLMNEWLKECCWLYNYFLAERVREWREEKKGVSFYDQCKEIKELRRRWLPLRNIYEMVLEMVAKRVEDAFTGFFSRVKNGKKKKGHPKMRAEEDYTSFTYRKSGFKIKDGKLWLSKIGEVKIKLHRPLEGKPKTCTIKRSPTNKWYAIFVCECETQPLAPTNRVVGIDMGIESFAVLSTGEKIPNPKFFYEEEKELARAQRKLSRLEKGTREWEKQRRVVARIHERIVNKRKDFVNKLVKRIIQDFDVIVVEDLKIDNMLRNRYLAKSIAGVAWGEFIRKLEEKAKETGRQVIKVNPSYTSQTCSNCGYRQKISLSQRIFRCPNCGLEIDRDYNAALNILSLASFH